MPKCRLALLTTLNLLAILLKISVSPTDPRLVEVYHRFAQKYGFKGPWDAADKVIKHWRTAQELLFCKFATKSRLTTVFDVFAEFKLHLVKDAEKEAKSL